MKSHEVRVGSCILAGEMDTMVGFYRDTIGLETDWDGGSFAEFKTASGALSFWLYSRKEFVTFFGECYVPPRGINHTFELALWLPKYADVDEEYDADDLDEYGQDAEYLADICHVEEYAEDVEGEKRDDCRLDGLDDDLFEVMECILERCLLYRCKSESEHECEDKRGHDIHHRRNCDGEVRREFLCTFDGIHSRSAADHAREERRSCKV